MSTNRIKGNKLDRKQANKRERQATKGLLARVEVEAIQCEFPRLELSKNLFFFSRKGSINSHYLVKAQK